MAFAPQEIKLNDDDGQHMTSIALEVTEMPEKQAGQKKLPATQRIDLDALTRLLDFSESVHVESWREECYATGISDTAQGKRKAFQRARTALLDSGMILTRDDQYWLAGHTGHIP